MDVTTIAQHPSFSQYKIQYPSYPLGAFYQATKVTTSPTQKQYLLVTSQIGYAILFKLSLPSSQLALDTPTSYLYDSSLPIPQLSVLTLVIPPNPPSLSLTLKYLLGSGSITLQACNFTHTVSDPSSTPLTLTLPASMLTCRELTLTTSDVVWQLGYQVEVGE